MAAGKGTRMDSDLPKVLHQLDGKPLISHVIREAKKISPVKIVVIIGHKSEMVKKAIISDEILFSYQREQKGTGHAVLQAEEHLAEFEGETLILSGDVPMIKSSTLELLICRHLETNSKACVLTAQISTPEGYGRVIRDQNNNLKEIKEHKDCDKKQLEIDEINSGIYIFNNKILFDLLPKLKNENSQSEYYLPDILPMINKYGGKIALEKIKNYNEIQGVNTADQLSELERKYEKHN